MSTNLDFSRAFVNQAREYLLGDYLPKLKHCLGTVTDEQIWWRPNAASNSIGNLLLHLGGNARQWIVSGLGGEEDHRVRQTEFDQMEAIPREQLIGMLTKTLEEVGGVLEAFDPANLLRKYSIQGNEVTALEAIFHVTEHFSMHTGQIILLTKSLTGKDPGFYDFSTGAPVETWPTP